jgi:cell wall assembly regulator SMI1
MRNLAELNIYEIGEAVGRPPPSPEVISAFERKFNVSLPSEYIELLRHSNGGYPELGTIRPFGRTDIDEWGVNHFFYLNEDRNGTASLWAATKYWQSILGERKIPFAQDAGGNAFVLDLDAVPPRVVVCIHADFETVEIADSFAEFIDRLEIDPDDI